MKITIILVSAVLLTLGSCSKTYSCNCTTVTTFPEHESGGVTVPLSSASTTSLKYVNGKQKDAKSTCTDIGSTSSFNMPPQSSGSDSVTVIMTCDLGEKFKE
ncbi:MAG: hypothetical protein P8N52_01335 [Crocinitomicaceae bacterium]|nr:hypothetical protein [Crocinitomicaceae bacterium]MDG1777066.1 hypothetical protein [Crocinitomicaceae bacterium]